MAEDGLIARLQGQIGALERKAGVTPKNVKNKVLTSLNEQLQAYDSEGKVVSILTRTDRGEINCYGLRIPPERIYDRLNLSIGARGPAVTCPPGTDSEDFNEHGPLAQTVSHRGMQRLTSFKKGFFVPLKGPGNEYIALINIDVDLEDPDFQAYEFPKRT
jgi:hypothetical protein